MRCEAGQTRLLAIARSREISHVCLCSEGPPPGAAIVMWAGHTAVPRDGALARGPSEGLAFIWLLPSELSPVSYQITFISIKMFNNGCTDVIVH